MIKNTVATHLEIKSSTKNYAVTLLNDWLEIIDTIKDVGNVVTIIDKNIVPFHQEFVEELALLSPLYLMDATEETKTLTGLEKLLQFLQQHNATKATTVIAIGGGIVQDVVSFAAHIYYRGLRFIFVPTTLLAMSDSCIGGKNGLNFRGFKNQLGAFHCPDKVLIWTGFINSLSDEAIYSGYGEIYKLMLIGGDEYYADLVADLQQHGFNNQKISDFIYHSLDIKKKFIEEDEFDVGVRRILNYGHTFGHAIELATNYEIPHGVAVLRGIDIANYIAYKLGFLSEKLYFSIHDFIKTKFNYGVQADYTAETLIANVKRDKKITNDKLNMIFLEQVGQLRIEPILIDDKLHSMLEEYLIENSAAHI